MNGWIIEGRVMLEPYNMTWDPRVRMHVIEANHTVGVTLEVDTAIELRDALNAFIALTSKPKGEQ